MSATARCSPGSTSTAGTRAGRGPSSIGGRASAHRSPSSYSLLNPWINEDGEWQHRNGYQTDILADDVVDFIDSTPDDQPFFAMYTPTSPHLPADDPRYDSMSVTPPRGPSFDQNTLTTKSPLYARREPLTSGEIHDADCTLHSDVACGAFARRRRRTHPRPASAIVPATRS